MGGFPASRWWKTGWMTYCRICANGRSPTHPRTKSGRATCDGSLARITAKWSSPFTMNNGLLNQSTIGNNDGNILYGGDGPDVDRRAGVYRGAGRRAALEQGPAARHRDGGGSLLRRGGPPGAAPGV